MSNKMKKKIIFFEIILLIASVFIFRGLWMLLDKILFMNEPLFLLLSFVIGTVVAIISFNYITNKQRK